jgi:hypothetical protein
MSFTFTVTRNNTTEIANPLTVNLSVGGTATFGVDYTVSGAASFTATTASLTIPANSTSATIVATQIPDTIVEPNETIILTIIPTPGVSILGANPAATATILNDDVGTSDPLFADVVLLLPLTTASGLVDVKSKVVTNAGSTGSTTVNDPFGNNVGVRAFGGGGSRISVQQSADFAFGNGAFAIDGWFYPTAFPGGLGWGIMDVRPQATLASWVMGGNPAGFIGLLDASQGDYEFSSSPLILNQWNYLCISRTTITTENHKVWINGALVRTAGTRNNAMTAQLPLIIGDQYDQQTNYDGSFTGYMSNIRITRAYRDGSIVPTAPFPTN